MAASTPTKEPETLTSGVTWKWKKTLADYPASEWGLVYYLRRNGDTLTSVMTFLNTLDGLKPTELDGELTLFRYLYFECFKFSFKQK